MSNYTKTTNFATKDNLSPGNPLKIVKGTEIDTEFNNISTAVATKTDNSAANITGGSITGITDLAVADGGTGASTAAGALNNLLPSQTSNANKYLQTDGTNATWDAVSLSTADITGTLPVANGGTGVTSSTGTGNVVLSNSPTLVTPALGTPASGTATNLTGLPLTSGVTGTLPVANGGTGITSLGTGVATFLGTPSSANLASAVTDETGSGALVFANSPTLVTPALGTPASGVLTNATGLPISTGVSGLGTGVATFLATPSSANLASAVSDETGSGALVFANSPTLVTPALGTPSALVGTNITGTASGLTAGNVTTNANLTGAVTSVGNATSLGSFSSSNLAGALTDETGSGSAVFATSPTLVTPILGTPTSATLTNATGLPIATGVSGLGTGIATALAVNVGSSGAPLVNGGVLGTPSSGTVTNLTGTASININGTVGATTASTGAFTTLTTSSTVTHNGGTANGVTYLNGSNVLTSGSALTFDGSALVSGASIRANSFMEVRSNTAIMYWENAANTLWWAQKLTGSDFAWDYYNGSTVAEAMRLTSTGLGIGTSSPAYKLHVSNYMGLGTQASSGSGAGINMIPSSNLTNWFIGANYTIAGAIELTPSTAGGGSTFTTPAFLITPTGNVGIGTTTPAAKLDVVGTIKGSTTISVGAATPSTSGAGITFPAIQSASSDANTLDDYEEGAWTASFVPNTSGSITMNNATGTYTKVGRAVTINGVFTVTSVSSPTGYLKIAGLPFSGGGGVSRRCAIAIHGDVMNATMTTVLLGSIQSDSNIYVFKTDGLGGVSLTTAADIKAGTNIFVGGTYNID